MSTDDGHKPWPFPSSHDPVLPIEMFDREDPQVPGELAGGILSLIDSPTHGAAALRFSTASGGPKDSLAGHVPSPRAHDGTAKAGPAGRGLVRTAIVEVEEVRLLVSGVCYEKGFAGDQEDPPYPSGVSYTNIYVMRDGEVFKVDIMPLLQLSGVLLDQIEAKLISQWGEGAS